MNLVKDMRLAHGMTVEAFAAAVGVSKGTIISAQNTNQITPELKAKVLRAFALDDTFFSYLDKKKKLEWYEYHDN